MVAESNAVLIKVGSSREIQLKSETVLGRQAECDVLLTEGHASRRHARLVQAEDGYWLEDLGSSNGTFINGNRISGSRESRLGRPAAVRRRRVRFSHSIAGAAPRLALDESKTVYRAPESAAVVAESSGMFKRPGAWADPDAMGDAGVHKTKFIDPAQMKQMASSAAPVAAAPSTVDGPHLQVVSGSRTGLNIQLAVGDSGNAEWTIGSQADREVQFMDSGVSALHAKIVNEGERWKVLDQMSANGTFVNGKRANVSYLSSGDRVRFRTGRVRIPNGCQQRVRSLRLNESLTRGRARSRRARASIVATVAFLATIAVLFARL